MVIRARDQVAAHLNLDESVSIIGLSATVSNSEEFGEWLSAQAIPST